jgi:hypothetical protein
VGSFVGVIALIAESTLGPAPVTIGGLAAYAITGGAIATVSRSVLAPFFPAPAARAGAVMATAAFGILNLLFYLNVRMLPGEHYLSRKSLLLDMLVIAPLLAGALAISRAQWAQVVRVRWGGLAAALGAVSLLGAGVLVLGSPNVAARATSRGDGPNLLVVVLDSLRADRLPAGGSFHATPALAALASKGRVYSSAWAASSWTVPSVAVILGETGNLGESNLPRMLAERGYRTACFSDNPHLSEGQRVVQGFGLVERSVGHWRGLLRGTALGEVVERLRPGSDSELVDKAARWARDGEGPFFLYVQLMDSHTPYRFPALGESTARGRRIEFPYTGMPMTSSEAEWIRERYDGGVKSADTAAARLVGSVAALDRPFLAIVTSDHGESLGEGGRWFHGRGLPTELLQIPLFLLGTRVEPAIVKESVGHAAIPRTLLAAAGGTCSSCDEVDLRIGGGSGTVRGGLPPSLAYGVRGHYKALLDLQTGRVTLHDTLADPEDKRDLSSSLPELAQYLTAGLATSKHVEPPDPAMLERLRALGYVGAP